MALGCVADEQWDAAYDLLSKVDLDNLQPIPYMKEEGTVEYQRQMIYNMLVSLGSAYHYMQGRKTRSAECFKKATQLDPTQAGVLVAKGRILYDEGKIEKAVRLWEKAVKKSPTIETWDSVGTNCLEVGRIIMGTYAMEQVYDIDPEYQGVNEKLAMLHLLMGHNEEFQFYNEHAKYPITRTEQDGINKILAEGELPKIFDLINAYLDRIYDEADDEDDFDDDDFDDEAFDSDDFDDNESLT
jgi:tetratricopeptide (TPR) repeat protein